LTEGETVETVFPAASGNSDIELTVAELQKYSHAKKWIDVFPKTGHTADHL
jgi:hypothetical protein